MNSPMPFNYMQNKIVEVLEQLNETKGDCALVAFRLGMPVEDVRKIHTVYGNTQFLSE
jgi:hypothetical protein